MDISLDELRRLAPKADDRILTALLPHLPSVCGRYHVATRLRFCHFIAQAAHETDGFRTLVEYGSADYFNKRYGPQTAVGQRLGNTKTGDGAKFRGRGIFQLTGRFNYATFGKRIGVDLIANPARAADPETSLIVACEYWQDQKLNALADKDDLLAITKRINGGTNGLKDRQAYLDRAKAIWPYDFQFGEMPAPRTKPAKPAAAEASDEGEAVPPSDLPAIATEAPPPLAKSKTLWGTVSGWLGGIGSGWSFNALFENPHAVWIIGLLLAFLLIGGLGVVIVFRERIARRLELGT